MSVITATITTETTEGVQVGLPILTTIGSVTIPVDVPAYAAAVANFNSLYYV